MADDILTPADAAQEFWKHLRDSATVMLGINDPDQHTQPMTAFAEPDSNTIWFFTRDDIDLARESRPGKDGRLVLVSKDREVYADIRGTLDCLRDRKRIDQYWDPMVAAWYPQGKDDPHLILLRFVPEEGQVWVSKKGLARLAFDVPGFRRGESQHHPHDAPDGWRGRCVLPALGASLSETRDLQHQ